MLWRHWLLVASVLSVGCAHASDDRLLTPADKARILDEQAASEDLKQGVGNRCAGSTKFVRSQARQRQYDTVEGFNTRGCGP